MHEGFILEYFIVLLEKIHFFLDSLPRTKKICSINDQFLLMSGEMDDEFLSEIIFISLQNFAFLLVISLRKKSICRQRRISLRLFNFLLIEENYIHFSSELSSSKNFSFTLLGLTISAQRGTISLLSREIVQPSSHVANKI